MAIFDKQKSYKANQSVRHSVHEDYDKEFMTAKHANSSAHYLKNQKKDDINAIKFFFFRMASFLLILFLLFGVVFQVVAVPDMSMKPKLMAGDIVLAYRFNHRFIAGDPVVYDKDGKTRVGRIVACPGDEVELSDGVIRINGALVSEADIYYKTDPFEDKVTYPLYLGDNEYFIMGDMREGARDSRYFGSIQAYEITGKINAVIRRSQI